MESTGEASHHRGELRRTLIVPGYDRGGGGGGDDNDNGDVVVKTIGSEGDASHWADNTTQN